NNNNGNNDKNSFSKEGYSFLSDVNFNLNQSTINEGYKIFLNEIAYLLKEDKNATVLLDGHSDITGNESFNDKLSNQRAEAVKRYLMLKGISTERIKIDYFGESKPKFSNNTTRGRALNRRVEIMIKRD
ncbi:MAG: hypothetical protein RL037_1857, partial [Bacteroidota bacterium]